MINSLRKSGILTPWALLTFLALLFAACETTWEWVAPEDTVAPPVTDSIPQVPGDSLSAAGRVCPDLRDTSRYDSTAAREALEALVGKQAHVFTGLYYAGDSLDFSTPPGITALYFWSTWCPISHAVRPMVNKVAAEWREIAGGDSLIFVGVSHEARSGLENFQRQFSHAFPLYQDASAQMHEAYAIRSFPTLIFLKRDTVVSYLHRNFSEAQLRSALAQAHTASASMSND